MREPTCETCRFWQAPRRREWTIGLCRRYPATLIGGTEEDYAAWPRTEHDDWCGEHQPAPEPSGKPAVEDTGS